MRNGAREEGGCTHCIHQASAVRRVKVEPQHLTGLNKLSQLPSHSGLLVTSLQTNQTERPIITEKHLGSTLTLVTAEAWHSYIQLSLSLFGVALSPRGGNNTVTDTDRGCTFPHPIRPIRGRRLFFCLHCCKRKSLTKHGKVVIGPVARSLACSVLLGCAPLR